jgi:hypothetical protein
MGARKGAAAYCTVCDTSTDTVAEMLDLLEECTERGCRRREEPEPDLPPLPKAPMTLMEFRRRMDLARETA